MVRWKLTSASTDSSIQETTGKSLESKSTVGPWCLEEDSWCKSLWLVKSKLRFRDDHYPKTKVLMALLDRVAADEAADEERAVFASGVDR